MTQLELEPLTAADRQPATRDSSDDWLRWVGEVPPHWDVKPLKHLASVRNSNVDKKTYEDGEPVRLCNYTDVYYNEYIRDEMELMAATATAAEIERFTLLRNDVIITKDSEDPSDIAVPACVAEDLDGVVCGYHLTLLRPNPAQIYGPFLLRALQASGMCDQFYARANGITRFGLGLGAIGGARIPQPPINEQRAIAAYLDHETDRIDGLIARKRQHLRLLAERRQALVTRAVIRGLDPDAPLADSGVETLGQIPAHWDVKPLMRLTPDRRQIMYGIVLPGPHFEGGVPIVKAGSVAPGRLRLDKMKRTDPDIEAGYVRSRLETGDIVYAIRGSIGGAEMIPAELDGANLTQDAARIAPADGVHGPWLLYAVKSKPLFAQLEEGALGTAVKGINIRDIKRGKVPVPPFEEQLAIAAHLDRETDRLRQLAAKVKESIERLREYRAALITAAVTGRVRVPHSDPA